MITYTDEQIKQAFDRAYEESEPTFALAYLIGYFGMSGKVPLAYERWPNKKETDHAHSTT